MSLKERIDRLSQEEQHAIEQSLRGKRRKALHDHSFSDTHIKFGYYSDPHVGEKHFSEKLWMIMLSRFKQEGISTVYCPGDNLEGMSGRPGHIYELAHVGATAQVKYASQLFSVAPAGMHFFVIDGNHDQWFKQKADLGLVAGEMLAEKNKNVTFLGEWEADVQLAKGVLMRLYHANDGTAYADSYKLQKLIESFTGGQKPNLVLSGHCNGVLIALYR